MLTPPRLTAAATLIRARVSGAALLLLFVVLSPACESEKARWAALELNDISFADLYLSVIDVLDSHGYAVASRDPNAGTIESDWIYGTSVRQVFGPSRRKALVEVTPSPRGEGSFSVRVRIREEVMRRLGLRATHIRESDDWEEWKDNFDEAEYLAAKLRALLLHHVVRVQVVAGER